jgi:hypothetical protein
VGDGHGALALNHATKRLLEDSRADTREVRGLGVGDSWSHLGTVRGTPPRAFAGQHGLLTGAQG